MAVCHTRLVNRVGRFAIKAVQRGKEYESCKNPWDWNGKLLGAPGSVWGMKEFN